MKRFVAATIAAFMLLVCFVVFPGVASAHAVQATRDHPRLIVHPGTIFELDNGEVLFSLEGKGLKPNRTYVLSSDLVDVGGFDHTCHASETDFVDTFTGSTSTVVVHTDVHEHFIVLITQHLCDEGKYHIVATQTSWPFQRVSVSFHIEPTNDE